MLIEGLREPRLDLAAFQEPIKTDSYDQVLDLVGPGFHLVHHDAGLVGDADHHGASIASRWPFGEVCEVDSNVTPPTADFACATLRAEVLAPDPLGPLLFVNHLPSWQPNFGYERELQAVAAARFVEEFVGWCSGHVVPGDDFDADPHAASVRFWSGRQSLGGTSVCYRNAWGGRQSGDRGHTFTPDNPPVADPDWPFRRIDYIFVRCGDHGGPTLEVSACAYLRRTDRWGVGERPLRCRRRPCGSCPRAIRPGEGP